MNALLCAAAEAILFSAGEPVPVGMLSSALELSVAQTEKLLEEMRKDYEARERGVILVKMRDEWQICTSPHVFSFVKAALSRPETATLSQAAIETLAIVAYKQPVTRSEIEQIRGVQSSSSLSLLVAKGLVCETGKLDLPGRPIGFSTTDEFLKLMKADSLDKLPSYESFSEAIDKLLTDSDDAHAVIE